MWTYSCTHILNIWMQLLLAKNTSNTKHFTQNKAWTDIDYILSVNISKEDLFIDSTVDPWSFLLDNYTYSYNQHEDNIPLNRDLLLRQAKDRDSSLVLCNGLLQQNILFTTFVKLNLLLTKLVSMKLSQCSLMTSAVFTKSGYHQ
jgi:hypothetical protein